MTVLPRVLMLTLYALPSDCLAMALPVGSLCLGVSGLRSPPSAHIMVTGPRWTLCMVRQPLLSAMGWLQSWVIGEVVALVALLPGIALSLEYTVWYGPYRSKAVISLRSPALVLLLFGLPLLPPPPGFVLWLSYIKRSFKWHYSLRPPLVRCSLLIS